MPHCVIDSPVGHLLLSSDEIGLTTLLRTNDPLSSSPTDAVLMQTISQLDEYFAGSRTTFTIPLHPQGTPFQQACWKALQTIPYGEVRTYGQQAQIIGRPHAVRAVGGANHRNPICIIIPCHRVIGANGALIGYGGGLDMKQWLLIHETKGACSFSTDTANKRS